MIINKPNWTSINHHLNAILIFYGNPLKLNLFKHMVSAAAKELGPDNELFSLGSLANKLTGRAEAQFAASLMEYQSVYSFLYDLDETYSCEINVDALTSALKKL